jgi:hypothetical protein
MSRLAAHLAEALHLVGVVAAWLAALQEALQAELHLTSLALEVPQA